MNIKLELSDDQKYVRIRTYTIVDGKEKMNQCPESYTTVEEIRWASSWNNLPKFVQCLQSRNRMIRYWNHYGVDLTKVYSDIKTLINTK